MSLTLSIDRLEGVHKEIAVLVGADELTINVPVSILPSGVKPGDMVTVTFKRDVNAGKKLAAKTKRVQDELTGTDSGGDLRI